MSLLSSVGERAEGAQRSLHQPRTTGIDSHSMNVVREMESSTRLSQPAADRFVLFRR